MAPRRAHGSIYRRRRGGKREAVWSISYWREGQRVTERAYSDRAASQQLLSQRMLDVAREEVGELDPHRAYRAQPLAEHLEDFLSGIGSRARSHKHLRLMRSRLQAAFAGMSAKVLGDLTLPAAEAWLAHMIDPEGLDRSVKTRDHYANALAQFGAWLEGVDRLPKNPFRQLRAVSKRDVHERRVRMALTASEVLRLVAAAEERPVAGYLAGHPQADPATIDTLRWHGRRRGLLYLFVALTGLRAAECRGIRWCDLELSEDPWVTPRAETTKAKRRESIPLDAHVGGRLRDLRTEIIRRTGHAPGPRDPVFSVPDKIAQRVREDAAWAQIPTVDPEGRILDFHALRATCATLLARAGVPLQLAGRLIRHVDPKLTARHYEKLGGDDLRRGSNLLSASFWAASASAPVTADPCENVPAPDSACENEPLP